MAGDIAVPWTALYLLTWLILPSFCPVSVIEGGISQAVPEHPKREYIFSLSTAFGDAYLFQVGIL